MELNDLSKQKGYIEFSLWNMDNKERQYVCLNQYVEGGYPVFIGDSIVEGFPLGDMVTKKIHNRGVSGDNTAQMKSRFSKIALPLKPAAILIWIGTNDIGQGLTLDDALQNIESVIDEARKEIPEVKICLLSICPVNEKNENPFVHVFVGTRTNETIKKWNAAYKEFAKKKGVTFMDFYDKLEVDGCLPDEYSFDGLHPNAKGYEPVAKMINQIL